MPPSLLGEALVFVFIAKLFDLRKDQPAFRPQWQTDLSHIILNPMAVGFVLLSANLFVRRFFGWAASDGLPSWVATRPFPVARFAVILVAGLMQYRALRAHHEVPLLWRLHAVHHSVESMDWRAGSCHHLLELLITRDFLLTPIFVLGFSKAVIDPSILIVGFQAVFKHANVGVRLGPLRDVIVSPNFHH